MGKNLNAAGAGGDSFYVVAALDTPALLSGRADAVCNGTNLTGGDQVEINAGFAAADTVILCPGTYWVDDSIVMSSGQSLLGGGAGTVIEVMDGKNAAIDVIVNTDAGSAGDDHLVVRNLKLDGNQANQTGGVMNGIKFTRVAPSGSTPGCKIEGCFIEEFRNDAIYLDYCLNSTIANNTCSNNGYCGIHLGHTSCNNNIVGNICQENDMYGIYLSSYCSHNTISGNTCTENNFYGISLGASNCYNTISGNTCNENDFYGISLGANNCYNTLSGNTCNENGFYGISLGANNCYNTFTGNTCNKNSNDGIFFETSCNYNCVVGNVCSTNGCQGIQLATSSNHNNISGNTCTENSQSADNTHSNIYLNGSDFNLINNNVCRMGTLANQPAYGVNIATGTCDSNIVRDNDLYDSGLTSPINDVGTDTEFNNITFQFIQGTTFIDADGSAKGWEIDLADEYAIALGQLPLELLKVVRIKIWAVGLAAPGAGNGMLLEINMNAGQDDEAYTAEAIAIANKVSTTLNFAVGDVIHWTVTSVDDTDIGDLIGGDSLEVKVKFESLANGDIDTDAVLRVVEIEYVT